MNAEQFCERYAAERLGTDSLKWDALNSRFGDPDLLAMWVADMEFKTCEAVTEALTKRVNHGVFGYSLVPEGYYDTFFNWQEKHHGYRPKREWLRFSPGIVPALYWFVNTFTQPGEAVIVLTPVYYPFQNAVRENHRKLVCCELVNTDGYYTIDYDRFEKDIVENQVKLFIHCSPHNPVGRVWKQEEQARLFEICERHKVLVVSDEIHQDLVIGPNKQIPAAIVAGGKYTHNLITANAPSKTFNLAAMQSSHIIIENPELRAKYDNYVQCCCRPEPNLFGLTAAQAAYTHGEEWLSGLLAVIRQNYEYAKETLLAGAPKLVISPMEGTYLMWVDLRAYLSPEEVKVFMQDKCRLAVDYGEWFGEKSKGFIRINLGTEPRHVKTAVEALLRHLQAV